MADISSINLNGNSYNIKDNNAVSKNDIIDIAHGGTSASTVVNARHALGVQAVQQVQASGGVAYKLTGDGVNGFIFTVMHGAASLNCICLVDIWDNIKYIGSFPSWLIIVKNTNDNSVIIQRAATNTASCIITAIGATIEEVAYDANRVTTNISPIVIPVEQGGTNATTAADARANLGAVSKSGDIITGNIQRTAENIDVSAGAPASTKYCSPYQIADIDGDLITLIEAYHDASDRVATRISTKRLVNGAAKWNQLDLLIDADGNRSYTVADSAAFRNALGASNGIFPITLGGTGSNTRLGALKNLTNEDVSTNANYFLTITSSWGKGGYTSVADAKKVLGLGGIQGRPDYTISKTDLTDGTSALTSGKLYLVYE